MIPMSLGQIRTYDLHQASCLQSFVELLPLFVGGPFEALRDQVVLGREMREEGPICQTGIGHDARNA